MFIDEKAEYLLTCVKNEIGAALLYLRMAVRYPDNYPEVAAVKEKLSLDLKWKAELYRLHPVLRPRIRTRQMRLPI